MDISKDRQRLRGLFYGQMRLLQTFLGIRGLVKGGIYKTKLKCGKKGCKCERGDYMKYGCFIAVKKERQK